MSSDPIWESTFLINALFFNVPFSLKANTFL